MSHDDALRGVRILDFTHAIYGALCTQILADAGADVVKVEPPWGDFMRVSREGHGQDSSAWLSVNRGKRSLSIDARTDEGRAVLMKAVETADILIHNFKADTMERMGFGWEEMRARNPRLIYMALGAFGDKGPLRRWAGGDMWAQAFGGVVATQGDSRHSYLAGVAFVDHGGAALAAAAVLLALRRRDQTGMGERVDTSLLDAVLFLQAGQVGDYLIENRLVVHGGRGWRGSFPMGAYRAKDGDIVIIHGVDDPEWKRLLAILEIEAVADDPRYGTSKDRTLRREELYPVLDQAFGRRTRAEWQVRFFENGLRADPCLTYEELFAHDQVAANDMLWQWTALDGRELRAAGVPYTVNGERPTPHRRPPALGEDSAAILTELGLARPEVVELFQAGVVFGEAPGDRK